MEDGNSTRARPDRPSVSIVVATHGRPAFLADCVKSIAADMADGDDLVVVECCNSEAAAALAGLSVPTKHLRSPHTSKCAKLNAGIRAARGDVILVTDDDCRVSPGWVEAMARPFRNPVVGATFGRVLGLSAAPGSSLPVIPPGEAPPELWFYAHGASMGMRTEAVVDVGGFDERLGPGTPAGSGEEHDLVLRFAARGWTCEIADAPPVDHLDWRDSDQSMRNLLAYQRGSGTYLGTGLRRDPGRAFKRLLLRSRYEPVWWHDRRTRGWRFGPRMSLAFAHGLLDGLRLRPRHFLDKQVGEVRDGSRPRVLWVTDEPPDRNLGGGNIRQAMLLDVVAERLDVTLLVMGGRPDEGTRNRLTEVLEVPLPAPRPIPSRVTVRRVRDVWQVVVRRLPREILGRARLCRALKPVVNRLADEFDVVIVHHLYLAPILPKRRRAAWLLHLFDVSSVRARQEQSMEPGRRQRWLLGRDASKAERYERTAASEYDGLVMVSEEDAAAITNCRRLPSTSPIVVIPNGVDAEGVSPPPLTREPRLLLPASLNYRPNVLGACWFCDEVLPLVQGRVPGVSLDLVGRQPVDAVLELGNRDGIEVHADVPSMAPWLNRARAVVVPLHVGTGTRLKALEAMAARRAVVGTSIGLEGLGVIDRVHARVVDDPVGMADAIVEVLTSDAEAEALAAGGRRLVEEHFRWDWGADRLAIALEATANGVRKRR
jgi:glycosyltransferase involved in cell wall biosynthesis/GT2 family glycosyltransferase